MTQVSTMALEVREFEWPRKQPEAPRAKNCLLALAMFSSTPCLADNEWDQWNPRHFAWGIRGGYKGGAMGALAPPLPESGRVYSVRTRSVT